MRFNVYSYTFYKNKDKMKEIQVALRSLQLRKKERNERNYFNRCSHCLLYTSYRNKETDNSRNGHSQKTMHTSYGDMEIDIPRDRKGEFEPQIVKKYQNTVTQDMEEKIISMYAKGDVYKRQPLMPD